MGKLKFACITGSMGNRCDRFMSCGYKEEISGDEKIKGLAETGVLEAVELCYDVDGCESDAAVVKARCEKYGVKVSGVNAPVTGEKAFKFGSLTNTDSEIRKRAIRYCKDSVDFAVAVGGEFVNVWMGQDGFDYVFQTDYTRQWNLLVEAVREICDYNPAMKIALEFKPREPRNRCILDSAGTTLLLAKDVGRPNVGLTVDFGHVFQSQGNIAQVIEMCANHGMLYNLHVNDNYGAWDDDMILGSVRYAEYIELCYSLRKIGYEGWTSVDIFPFREPAFRAAEESIRYMKLFDEAVDRIGFDKLTACINGTDATEAMRLMREAVFK
ncbi:MULTISPECIES: sugar phosphate isomerase/epimerase family protein [Anaerotruncus]|jgi:sugar phosphate isomerase/epimerase|uniref:Xylose isomerase n=1 Tax=Anaerotruncus colihominis TaxID=169435 RepID=A0A845STU1_9FIRM|nr:MULTISPECIES: sugar phosphate isomerase/epimerase family protein [Anaerotruncus]MCI8492590.1 sugar phosphate isomerase/epimerase [Anaerotruncus sp.]MCR2024576.1 sugar phosphate isomerase/epimerase [Anaerotruncus colihominis]NDO39936.1 sugar phosphate isomerase/epimerase [Anaerotruncus colihominis]